MRTRKSMGVLLHGTALSYQRLLKALYSGFGHVRASILIKYDDGIKSKWYLFAMCVFLHDAEFKLELTVGLACALWHNLLTRLLN